MYNEEAIAERSLTTILQYIEKIPAFCTILVVNDGSKDKTGERVEDVIRQVGDKRKLQMIVHHKNQGYGAGIRTGVKFAIDQGYDYVVFMDSDLTDDPKYLRDMYEKMREGCDYIKTTRFASGGGYEGVPWKRRVISRLGNKFAHYVTGLPLTDFTAGYRAVRVEIFKHVTLTENRFSLIVEELMKARPYVKRFCEIPRVLGTRGKGSRPTSFHYTPATFWSYLKYILPRK